MAAVLAAMTMYARTKPPKTKTIHIAHPHPGPAVCTAKLKAPRSFHLGWRARAKVLPLGVEGAVERRFRHEVTYTNSGPVPVAEVAASLVANERLMREALEALQELFPGLEITDVSVVFRSATSNSPLQEAMEAVGSVIFQNDLDKKIPLAVRDLTGADFPHKYDSMVTIIVIAIVTYGVYWALAKLGKKDDAGGLAVHGNYNNIIHVGRDILGVSDEQFRGTIEKRFAKSRGAPLARRALEMIRPAKIEDGAGVVGGGAEITPETVAAAPALGPADQPEDRETQDAYTNQPIVIHATDLDSQKSGWAGHLPGIWEKRMPMRLFPAINPERLFGRHEVTGDVIVMSRKNEEGDYVPYLFHVIGVD